MGAHDRHSLLAAFTVSGAGKGKDALEQVRCRRSPYQTFDPGEEGSGYSVIKRRSTLLPPPHLPITSLCSYSHDRHDLHYSFHISNCCAPPSACAYPLASVARTGHVSINCSIIITLYSLLKLHGCFIFYFIFITYVHLLPL